MKLKNALKITSLCLALTASYAQAGWVVDSLSRVRPQITFNELSAQDKRQLAEQVQVMLRDLYVHRYLKDTDYGVSTDLNRGHVDPADAIALVVKNAANMSTRDLHNTLSKIINSQRDLHLNYNMPMPHQAYSSFLPFTFARTVAGGELFEVRIEKVYPYYFNAFFRDQRIPAVGDVVLSYDGKPVQQAAQAFVNSAAGANAYGGFSRAIQRMTFIPHVYDLPPASNSVVLKLRAASTGEVYSINIPWTVQYNTDSFNQGNASAAAAAPAGKASVANTAAAALSSETVQERFNEFVQRNGGNDALAIPLNNTQESTVKWAVVTKGSKKIGYLSLSSFVPGNMAFQNAVGLIQNLLRNQLAATDALVIDVRNNGGGYITYADMLYQLFTPGKALVGKARLLNTPLNKTIFDQEDFQGYEPWDTLIHNAAKTKDMYSQTGAFTDDQAANWIGQVYYKPVGVLANARTFSAGDLFTCGMQDNKAATIFGEDPQTGAGGANVVEYDGFFVNYAPALFRPLPGGVSMRVSWRQSVRANPRASLIEDQGCAADIVVPRVALDLSNNSQTQFDKVATYLLTKPASRSTYKLFAPGAQTPTNAQGIPVAPAVHNLNLQVTNTERVKVYVNDVLSGTYSTSTAAQTNVSVSLPAMRGNYILSIVGEAGGAAVWNTKRVVVVANND